MPLLGKFVKGTFVAVRSGVTSLLPVIMLACVKGLAGTFDAIPDVKLLKLACAKGIAGTFDAIPDVKLLKAFFPFSTACFALSDTLLIILLI